MCGIAGLYDPRHPEVLEENLGRMARAVAHRGPDDEGLQVLQPDLGFAHRRLSIVDLSPLGHQPMSSQSGRYTIVLNGEIYNFRELRERLRTEGAAFRSHTDTEVLLAALEVWGLERTLRELVGMFAFAVWDKMDARLTLARDRAGEKPLYYGWNGGAFYFCSELKSLFAVPGFRRDIDEEALGLFFRYNYVPAPYSIIRGISKLPAAHYARIGLQPAGPNVELVRYWSYPVPAGQDSLGLEEATERLEELLGEVIAGQMIADVPLGAFLSGGYDSTTVAALMQVRSSQAVRTFSIGFSEAAFDESRFAASVAEHLGTRHTELRCDARLALELVPALPAMYDEPFADSSQLPTALLSRLTRQHVTVSLSGDGGDEVFGGYVRHQVGPQLWDRLRRIPRPLRAILAAGVGAAPGNLLAASLRRLLPAAGKAGRIGQIEQKLDKVYRVLGSRSLPAFYETLVSSWDRSLVAGQALARNHKLAELAQTKLAPASLMMMLDYLTYLPDDGLVKVDRAGMAYSLESRAPYLDHRVVAFARSLPPSLLVDGGETKIVLKNLCHRHVPRKLMERPKMGFGIPLGQWLRSELREWAMDLLSPARLNSQALLDSGPILRSWQRHLDGRWDESHRLWAVLMFQSWYDKWML